MVDGTNSDFSFVDRLAAFRSGPLKCPRATHPRPRDSKFAARARSAGTSAVAAVRPSVQTAPKARGSFSERTSPAPFKISEGARDVLFLGPAPRRLCEPTAGWPRRPRLAPERRAFGARVVAILVQSNRTRDEPS